MNKQQATRLLDETFNSEFEVLKFSKFLKELVNNSNLYTIDKTQYVPEEFKEYILKVEKLGQYKDGAGKSMEFLAIQLAKHSSLERARTMQRNFIAKWLAKNSDDPEGAIVAFYDEQKDWRFSFVKLEYHLIKDEKGNLTTRKELTPAKRYSYLVGPNEPNHTCKKQFVELLSSEHDPLLEEIEKAFGIEKVTKEFFEEYKKRFLDLKESLERVIENDEVVKAEFIKIAGEEHLERYVIEFSKKLLGQIVFLYFLQKKGWLGVKKDDLGRFRDWGTGPKDFMRRLFNREYCSYNNFFNDVLEPLFYNTLAIKRNDDFSDKFDCKIPFLNGGLFEPLDGYDWMNTNIYIENSIFADIFNTFDTFNFTVKEDEPLEKEVAVDPEMLGKVFENLLEVTDRKSKGAFYTPREIVHYMCQQSLINYLETNSSIPRKDIEKFIQEGDTTIDSTIRAKSQIKKFEERLKRGEIQGDSFKRAIEDAYKNVELPKSISTQFEKVDTLLREIKVVDPAVGSGAFPVGMMNEIVKARSILSIYFDTARDVSEIKRECIENSLYGVDIMPSAVDICQLRFWLSLVVDEVDRKKIKPLPNLDNKIMCGNSLLEEFEGVKLFDDSLLDYEVRDITPEIERINDEIRALNEKSGLIARGKLKGTIKEVDREIRKLERKRNNLTLKPEIKETNLTLTNFDKIQRDEAKIKLRKLKAKQKEFFNSFDRDTKKQLKQEIEKLEWELIEATLKQQGNEEAIKKLNSIMKSKSKPFFLWKLYFAEVFQRENPGFDVVIGNPPYVGEKGNKEIFQEIKNGFLGKFHQGKMDLFYFFFHLSLDIGRKKSSIAFITTNYYTTATGGNNLRTDFKNRAVIKNLIDFNELRIFESALGQHNMITILLKDNIKNSISSNLITKRRGIANSFILNKILDLKDDETDYFLIKQEDLYESNQNYIRLQGINNELDKHSSLLQKIIKNKTHNLEQICYIHQGLKSNSDKITSKHISLYPDLTENNIKKGEGIFIISKKNSLLDKLNDLEKTFIKPFFKNSDIKKYFTKNKPEEFVIFITNSNYINEKNHPNLFKHFNKYISVLKNRAEVEPRGRIKLFSLTRPRQEYMYPSDKIVAPFKSKGNIFGYNQNEWYASGDVYYLNLKNKNFNLRYILSILNSKLFEVWLYKKGKRKGDMVELYQKPLSEIPIKEISPEQQKPFIQLVDQILLITKDEDYLKNPDKQAKVKKLEKEIDAL
ncbi:MAG: Eco57I restriction-modification methylase domain-containing protein, partial [Candidatus Woesearchaeota archaeon]